MKLKKKEPLSPNEMEAGNYYTFKDDYYFGKLYDIVWNSSQAEKLKKLGYVNDKKEVVIPAGTKLKYLGRGHDPKNKVFDFDGDEFDTTFKGDEKLYQADKD